LRGNNTAAALNSCSRTHFWIGGHPIPRDPQMLLACRLTCAWRDKPQAVTSE